MSRSYRVALFLIGLLALSYPGWNVIRSLPAFGAPTSGYGDAVNRLAPRGRNVSNMVSAVNFDIRGFDTLGEEIMLLCAVTGAVVLLRGSRGEHDADTPGRVPGRADIPRADATALMCRFGVATVLLFGLYVVLHGTVTPGGGFQGGVIAASGLLLLYLGEGYRSWRDLIPAKALAVLEGSGAIAFVLLTVLPLLAGRPALDNLMPLGKFKDLYSGGLIFAANFAVGLAVTGSFGQLLLEFMEETRSPADESMPDEADE